MVTEEQVREVLKNVWDPELGVNVVDLGLIYGVDINDRNVTVKMTLTTQGCPLHETMPAWVKEAVEKMEEVDNAEVEVVWSPPWNPDMMSEEAKELLGY